MSRFFTPMRWLFGTLAVVLLSGATAQAQDDMVDKAFAAAARTFERALPHLDTVTMGVPLRDYRDALTQRRFASSRWGDVLGLQVAVNESERGLCAGYAAYVTPEPERGAMSLVICPQFFSPDADGLRETTILHEMVHVVAGPDECQAMAFTARVQQMATGTFQPVERYWTRNHCETSRYKLPD